MALSQKQVEEARSELDECKNPLFLFDDDQDGLCSFLQMYRYKKEGKGSIVKTVPKISMLFMRKVEEYSPDKIFILDIADVEQEFIDEAKRPIVWIDHHGPFKRHNIKYYNPRVSDFKDNFPTSFLCHQIVQQDLWIATLGCIADWHVPDFIEEFRKDYSDLIGDYKKAGDIIYNTRLGELIRVLSFILKGKNSEVSKCIKIMTRIESPYEILDQTTEQGKFIYKRYKEAVKQFEPLRKQVLLAAEKETDKVVFFKYNEETSYTSDLSNEAIYRHPDKIIIIAREKGDEYKASIRSAKIDLKPIVEKSLIGLEGYGGGHEYACGLNIKIHHFEEFFRRFRESLDS